MKNIVLEEQEKTLLRQDLVNGKQDFESLPFIGL